MRTARWTTPSLRLRSVVAGTSQLPAPFEPNPTLLRPPFPSQCPAESTEDILPHPVYMPLFMSLTADRIPVQLPTVILRPRLNVKIVQQLK